MPCKNCGSGNVQRFDGELTLSARKLSGLNSSPVYVCQTVVVCLECGFSELAIPAHKLESLNKERAARAS